MRVESLDHLVLTVRDLDAAQQFYADALGMTPVCFAVADGTQRHALSFGNQKINLHIAGAEFEPKSAHPTPGSADLCFLVTGSILDWVTALQARNISVEMGPVARTGATGKLTSIYVRDPDDNLIELSVLA